MLRDLLEAAVLFAPIAAGVGLLAVVHYYRDDQADVHDVSDYHQPEPTDEPEQPEPAAHAPAERPALTDVPWRPPYAELTVAQVTRRYGDGAEDIAARWLREFGERAQLELAR